MYYVQIHNIPWMIYATSGMILISHEARRGFINESEVQVTQQDAGKSRDGNNVADVVRPNCIHTTHIYAI